MSASVKSDKENRLTPVERYTYDSIDRLVSEEHYDATNDLDVLAHYEYDPFGNSLVATGALAAANPFRFSTKYTADETGLIYYGLRYYSPALGRWLKRDPFGEVGGKCLYGFASGDPLAAIDLLGLVTGNWQERPEREGTVRTVAHTDYASTFEHECCGAWWKFGRGSWALSITFNYWSQIVFEPSTSPKWSQDLHWRDPYVERAWRTTRDFPMRKSAVRVHEQRHVKDDSTAYDAVKKMLETYEKEYSSKTECEKAYDEAEKKAREMLNDAATRSQARWN